MNALVFPIQFRWVRSGEVEQFDSLEDVEWNVEDFDSDSDGSEARVTDAKGRAVRIRISVLSTEIFELLQGTDNP